jgi:hypothetical protein
VPKSGQPWIAGFLEQSPLLRHFQVLGWRPLLEERWPTLDEYSAFVESERQARASELPAVRFAPPARRPRRARRSEAVELNQLYDARIALQREVPCLTSCYHDLLNVLAWAAFPRAKRALHARQYRALTTWLPAGGSRLPNRRTREQDALTLFDEGGSVLVATPDLVQRLATTEPRALPLEEEPGGRVVLFGHAVMEHIVRYRTPVRSAALLIATEGPLPEGRGLLDLVDQEMERRLLDDDQFQEPSPYRVLSIQPPGAAWV